jgi:hypothetical protein
LQHPQSNLLTNAAHHTFVFVLKTLWSATSPYFNHAVETNLIIASLFDGLVKVVSTGHQDLKISITTFLSVEHIKDLVCWKKWQHDMQCSFKFWMTQFM